MSMKPWLRRKPVIGSLQAILLVTGCLWLGAIGAPAVELTDKEQDGKGLWREAPPQAYADDFGGFETVLRFNDGRPVRTPVEWGERRREILSCWHRIMGPWPPVIDAPKMEVTTSQPREDFIQNRVRVEIAPGRLADGWLLVPRGKGPFPAVLVPYYEPETSIGLGTPLRDFAYQLARRGFVTLSIGSPGGDARKPDLQGATCQPLSYLAYVAANCANALAHRPEVDSKRMGIVGHSYGGKWALFAGALCERFAAIVVSDPGIVWDETRPNVNYWEPWYLGYEDKVKRPSGMVTPDRPRTGAYRELVEHKHNLHELLALMAPRALLVSGGAEDPPERWRALNHVIEVNLLLGQSRRVGMSSRATHAPTPESNEAIYRFLERFLGPAMEPQKDRDSLLKAPRPLVSGGRAFGT